MRVDGLLVGPGDAPDARERRRAFEGALARYPGVRLAGCWEGRFSAVTGQLAALLERIADPALPPRAERLPATLIVRESCGCLGQPQ